MKKINVDNRENLVTLSKILDSPIIETVFIDETVCFVLAEKPVKKEMDNIDDLVLFHAQEMEIDIDGAEVSSEEE